MISVKICGVTSVEQVRYCQQAGVAALGLMFVKASPRCLEWAQAREIFEHARHQDIATVFVFKDQDEEFIRALLHYGVPDFLQFHGLETPEYCARFKVPYIKSCSVTELIDSEIGGVDFQQLSAFYRRYRRADAILLDHHSAGSGQSWSWQRIPALMACRTIIAGGLNVDNIATAIKMTGCPAFDLSSGAEDSPGHKSESLINDLMAQTRASKLPESTHQRFSF